MPHNIQEGIMDPSEAWIGKVMFVGLVGLAIWAVTALLQGKSEGAHRLRVVIGGALALSAAAILFASAGPVGFIVVIAIIGACIWIFKGFKK